MSVINGREIFKDAVSCRRVLLARPAPNDASTDGGITFADKINLSNSTGAESQDVEIAAEGDSVIVTWWERNATSMNQL